MTDALAWALKNTQLEVDTVLGSPESTGEHCTLPTKWCLMQQFSKRFKAGSQPSGRLQFIRRFKAVAPKAR